MEDIFMSNSQNAQNAEILNLLQSLVTNVNNLTSNLNDLNNKVDNLTGNMQILSAEVQEVKADVRELKSWARATDIRLDNMDNKLVSFATEFTYLRDEVDSLNLRLNSIEAEIAAIKERQAKSEEINEAFRQEVLQRFKVLERDLAAFRRHVQIDILSFAKDLTLFEERLEKIESKLEVKN
jgi:chromosome segregation ATPase